MNNSIRTSEVLNKAADLIEERGWTKYNAGWGGSGSLCLEGAIAAAIGDEWEHLTLEANTCPAGRAVRDYLTLPDAGTTVLEYCMFGSNADRKPLWRWNDTRDAASEVIEVLRAAAVIEAAREDARIIPGPVVPAPVEDETSVSA